MLSDTFNFFANLIERELGIVYSDFNRYQLENRLEEAVKMHGLKTVTELQVLVQSGHGVAVKQSIFDLATNNETSFFRDEKLFATLAAEIFPNFANKPLRLWCAACSAGQEPYSIVMMHLEKPVASRLEVLATDVSTPILQRAREGIYTGSEVNRGLSPGLKSRYFDPRPDGRFAVKSQLRSLIRFERRNLLEPMGQLDCFDVIFCRNVLIYQDVANKARVVAEMTKHLTPGGYLVLGAGESLLGVSDRFTTIRTSGVVYYQMNAAAAA